MSVRLKESFSTIISLLPKIKGWSKLKLLLKLRDENILIIQNVISVFYNIYEAIKIVKTILGVILKSNSNDEKKI